MCRIVLRVAIIGLVVLILVSLQRDGGSESRASDGG